LSCSKEAEVFPLGQDYYPISIGDYRTYNVTETTYVGKVESVENYQIRESFYDAIVNETETTYLMRVERRETDQDNWVSIENIAIRQEQSLLYYQVQNITLTIMTYPIRFCHLVDELLLSTTGGSCFEWDGNAQNTESTQLYHYEELSSGDFTFDDSNHIKVVISNLPANIVEQDERFEIFAQGIGLVERNFIEIAFCQQGCGGVNEPEDGRILVQRLIEYGSD